MDPLPRPSRASLVDLLNDALSEADATEYAKVMVDLAMWFSDTHPEDDVPAKNGGYDIRWDVTHE